MTTTITTSIPAIFSLFPSSSTTSSLQSSPPNFSPFNFTPSLNPRLRISHKYNAAVLSKRHRFVHVPSCCTSSNSNAEIDPHIIDDNSSKESSINIQLPRRSLLVQFTCNACGERSKRLINRLAYERGTVFVQCAGCLQHHRLVDNLGLVVEYDFRDDTNEE